LEKFSKLKFSFHIWTPIDVSAPGGRILNYAVTWIWSGRFLAYAYQKVRQQSSV